MHYSSDVCSELHLFDGIELHVLILFSYNIVPRMCCRRWLPRGLMNFLLQGLIMNKYIRIAYIPVILPQNSTFSMVLNTFVVFVDNQGSIEDVLQT